MSNSDRTDKPFELEDQGVELSKEVSQSLLQDALKIYAERKAKGTQPTTQELVKDGELNAGLSAGNAWPTTYACVARPVDTSTVIESTTEAAEGSGADTGKRRFV